MVYVYILKSLTDNGYYVGICKDLEKRLNKHNKGGVSSTRRRRPFTLIHSEQFENYSLAREREKQVKSWHGGNAFKKLVAAAAGSSNGRTRDFGSRYHGSNPCPAAAARSI